jgi:hypothetical protein
MKGGFYLRGTNVRLRGITKRLDREFRRPREYVGKRGAAFRRRAIAVGNRVDAQLTKYFRTKSIKGLGAQAKVRALISRMHRFAYNCILTLLFFSFIYSPPTTGPCFLSFPARLDPRWRASARLQREDARRDGD